MARDPAAAAGGVQFCRTPQSQFIVMGMKPLKGLGRGMTSLFKFVYLTDLSGMM